MGPYLPLLAIFLSMGQLTFGCDFWPEKGFIVQCPSNSCKFYFRYTLKGTGLMGCSVVKDPTSKVLKINKNIETLIRLHTKSTILHGVYDLIFRMSDSSECPFLIDDLVDSKEKLTLELVEKLNSPKKRIKDRKGRLIRPCRISVKKLKLGVPWKEKKNFLVIYNHYLKSAEK